MKTEITQAQSIGSEGWDYKTMPTFVNATISRQEALILEDVVEVALQIRD